jgi:ribonuclease VapC
VRDFDLRPSKAGIEPVEVDVQQAQTARLALRDHGKGRHRAGLKFGDCFACAQALTRAEPLLRQGENILATTIEIHAASR